MASPEATWRDGNALAGVCNVNARTPLSRSNGRLRGHTRPRNSTVTYTVPTAASILLFLTHLSKDPFIVETILKHASAIFSSFPVATFQGDVEFLKDLAKDVDKIVLHDKDFSEIKEERLRRRLIVMRKSADGSVYR